MCSNNMLNFQESTTILNAYTKSLEIYWMHHICIKYFIAYRSSSRPDCIFEIHQLWQSGFSRVYSNSCCNCSFEPETLKSGQSTHKMYSNSILIFQESTIILNVCTKKVWKLIECNTYITELYAVLIFRTSFSNSILDLYFRTLLVMWMLWTYRSSWNSRKPSQFLVQWRATG